MLRGIIRFLDQKKMCQQIKTYLSREEMKAAILKLRNEYGLGVEEIAAKTGRSKEWIEDALR